MNRLFKLGKPIHFYAAISLLTISSVALITRLKIGETTHILYLCLLVLAGITSLISGIIKKSRAACIVALCTAIPALALLIITANISLMTVVCIVMTVGLLMHLCDIPHK